MIIVQVFERWSRIDLTNMINIVIGHKVLILTFWSSASRSSKPGIPLGAPLGAVLTNFSVVVLVVRVGDMVLKIYLYKFLFVKIPKVLLHSVL